MAEFVRDVTARAAAAEDDRKLLDKLVDIRAANADDSEHSEDLATHATDADWVEAFREVGIDIVTLPPAESGARSRRDRPQSP